MSKHVQRGYNRCSVITPAVREQDSGRAVLVEVRNLQEKVMAIKLQWRARENDFYPHYVHNLDNNLGRFGGLFPPVGSTPSSRSHS